MKSLKNYVYFLVGIAVLVALYYLLTNGQNQDYGGTAGEKFAAPAPSHTQRKKPLAQPSKFDVSKKFLSKVNLLKKAIKNNPKDTLSMREYADLMSVAHNPKVANKYYLKILKIDRRRVDILFSLVSNYYRLRNIREAKKFNEKILRISPNDIGALYNKGVFLFTEGKIKQAEKAWKYLIKKFPNSPAAKLARQNLKRIGVTRNKK